MRAWVFHLVAAATVAADPSADVAALCEGTSVVGGPDPVTVTQVGKTSVRVDAPGAKYVWVTDYDNYIYAADWTFSGSAVLQLESCNEERTSCEPSMPANFQASAHWGTPTCALKISETARSWNTMVEDYVAADPEASIDLTADQYTALNTWQPSVCATMQCYQQRGTGGGEVTLSRPEWLTLGPNENRFLFVRDNSGLVLYFHVFSDWPSTADQFSDTFVLPEDVTSLTACVTLPNLECANGCPEDLDYNGGTQKCQQISFLDHVITEIETAHPNPGALALSTTPVSTQASVSLSAEASGTTLRISPPDNCGSDGSTIYAKDSGALLGYTEASQTILTVTLLDVNRELDVYLLCNNVLTTAKLTPASLDLKTASDDINQNNPNPATLNQDPCEARDSNDVMQIYPHGSTYVGASGKECTCLNGVSSCDDSVADDDSSGLSYNEKVMIAVCSMVLGLVLVAIVIFVYKKRMAFKGGKGYMTSVELASASTTTQLPPGPPPMPVEAV